ncbi:hypothetical protein [Natrinema hispanicum]|uniref:DUF7995 domain-containing protein n=1 Tax=Natrinema hispanicum TaxID=392421 RepID=A0A1I0JCU7_9EURY|nr:hypothetical protein [Natrinema hispanicum]RZV06538.1 hypothetical protein BDK88_3552 [Natrinema hispanicum]SDD60570.1 hypothetical protein SAMN05192552_10346 [Natrinema hispanicum]SEU07769.1 hypothetical protein SAMN04488694_1387 [Natrinema hispanicum]
MTDRDSDFEELRPTGEASHIPDETLSECTEGEPNRQRVATATTGYPDTPTETDTECRSCSAPIPADQTKCLFCLTNHLEDSPSETNAPATEWTLLGVVHMLVESSTFYGAVAKGAAAATLLATSATESTVDDCTSIYDLEDEPAAQLTDQWPVLPAAAQITSTDGEQLLAAARDRTTWSDQLHPAADSDHEPTTYLYDEGGTSIRDEQRLATLLDNAGDDAWLVPAIALQQTPDKREPEHLDSLIPTKECLECHQCGCTTDHRFSEHESVPDETWTGHAIWECQVCGTPCYGPSPE